MILECACGKMYRVRDDAAQQPAKCPACGGALRAAVARPPEAGSPRVKELETRIQLLESELETSRAARATTLSVETSPGVPAFADQVAELKIAAGRADQLQRENFDLRSEMERRLKDKDRETGQAREALDRESAERRKQEARASSLEENHARAIEEKEKTLQALDASLESYRSKIETLQKKLDAVEFQRLADLNTFDSRLRDRDKSDRADLDRATGAHQQALSELRAQMEEQTAEKDRLITEGRQNLDREAAERRRLSEALSRIEETTGRAVAEKEAALAALNATLSSYKSKIEGLQGRVNSLEQLRRSEADHNATRLRNRSAVRARVEEAGHLAGDLDHSLDGIEASVATLRDRIDRLKKSLEEASAEPADSAPLSAGFAQAGEQETASPALSQAGWGPPAPVAPSLVEEPAPAVEPLDEVTPEKPQPAEEPALEVVEPASAPKVKKQAAPAAKPESAGKVDEPSRIIEAVKDESDAVTDAIPLISPPEDEEPAAKAADPQKSEEKGTKKRFSWQRK